MTLKGVWSCWKRPRQVTFDEKSMKMKGYLRSWELEFEEMKSVFYFAQDLGSGSLEWLHVHIDELELYFLSSSKRSAVTIVDELNHLYGLKDLPVNSTSYVKPDLTGVTDLSPIPHGISMSPWGLKKCMVMVLLAGAFYCLLLFKS